MPCTAPLSQLFTTPEHRHAVPVRVCSCTISVDFQMEDQETMCNLLRVQWTITPRTAPQPWLACSGCGGLRAFQASGKIRLNANGRKLDAWLIYRCLMCDKSWNRPIFERENVRDISPAVLEALQSNDPQWIRAEAFNLEALRRKSQRVDEFPEFDIAKQIRDDTPDWAMAEIDLMVPLQAGIRLDRLLASELGLSRSMLQKLQDDGSLRAQSERSDLLRRRVKNGTRIVIARCGGFDPVHLWKPVTADF
ncbi:DUF1062 domain-containing protein [Agrobacterium sp. YIC 4121]|uniref:DUF1062 domain-containing protein n=1 Tax=Agrobacterium sp. YIC 4121 TaxID=1923829 RepID=UPI0009CB36BF|nr:DUF1062 domain-containing protein [Agrobacterium sp. YIC 4121]OOO29884.1 hypothetical protein BTE54_14605 [Agrobacterium sp. YIC 4121]